tara:strand:- start:77 stop:346 length:270 start_codon:yes stop_codon:yes gene_type:complete
LKVVINKQGIEEMELGVIINLDDIKAVRPDLQNWQAQHVLDRLQREYETGVFYEAAIQQIKKWAQELHPKATVIESELDTETFKTPKQD